MSEQKDEPQALRDEDLDGIVGGAAGTIAGIGGIGTANLAAGGMDLDAMINAVALERNKAIETAVQEQVVALQERNAWLSSANAALAELRTERPAKAAGTGDYGSFQLVQADGTTREVATKTWLEEQGITIENKGNDSKGGQSDFDAAIAHLKSAIDAQSSASQTDMLRLQSLSNKRNEAFDLMANMVEKMQQSRDSIIGNMR